LESHQSPCLEQVTAPAPSARIRTWQVTLPIPLQINDKNSAADMNPPFLIITLPRSGSYHLRALLDSAPDIKCYGEIFKGSLVELPPAELAVVGLKATDIAERDQMGMAILNKLRKETDRENLIFGFKDFRFNLNRAGIYQQILNSKGWRKVFLFRNPIERYISMERADLTGVFVVTEKTKDKGLDLKRPIRFDPEKFEKSMGSHRRLTDDARKAAAKHGDETVLIVNYDTLNDLAARKQMMEFVGSASDGQLLQSTHVKQFTAPLESGVENWSGLTDYLAKTQQMDLLTSPGFRQG
jgi:hypothetical protein